MIRDELVRLRALEPEDLEWLYKWENDMELWDVSDTLTPYSMFTLKKYLESKQELDIYAAKQLRLVIESVEDQLPVGLVDLYSFDPFHLRAGVGIMIHKISDRKQGYATSAIRLVSTYAFDTLCLHQLYCTIPACNRASIALFTKCDFIPCGTRKDWLHRGEDWEDVVMLQIINPVQAK